MQKVVFLVDMNAFFISCEMTRDPLLRGKPAAVAGNPKTRTGIILAANYEARAYGVKTAMVLHEAKKLCPNMLLVPPDHHFYSAKSRQVMDLLSNYTPVLQQNSIDEAWLDMTGMESLFGTPVEAAKTIMKDIEDALGLWCSIGIAQNKFLAKMASEMKKPLGITELWEADIPEKLWPLDVAIMYGVGKKTAEKLDRLGIHLIGDLAKADRNILAGALGKHGLAIYRHANGIDNEPVVSHQAGEMKSVGRETTLSEDISDVKVAQEVLLELSDDVGMTLRKYGKKGRTVHITLKYTDFKSVTRQTTVAPTSATRDIYRTGCALLEKNWSRSRPVRLIGISVSGFDGDGDTTQLSFFDSSDNGTTADKHDRVDRAIDTIRNRHGNDIIKPPLW